jgi:hypothetical protein
MSAEYTVDAFTAADTRYVDYLRRKMDYSKSLPEFGVGKVFDIPVADSRAYYEVTAVTDDTATVSIIWPEDPADDELVDLYTDPFIGGGGTFERERIEPLTARHDTIARIFGG